MTVITEVLYGSRSDEWAGVRAVAELGVALHVEVPGPAGGALFLVPDDRPARLAGPGAPADTYGPADAAAELARLVRARRPEVTEVVPIGAVQRDPAGRTTTYLPAEVGVDVVFSRASSADPHAFLEVDLDRRNPDDLTFIERELKLDADADPRPAAERLRFGDGVAIFSGSPTACVHFHRIYDVGPSGLFEMTSDPDGGPKLLKHKRDLGDPGDPVYRRLETVEPSTPESIRRVMADLDPSADPAQVPVTPYFRRDRIRTNVFIAKTRSVYVVYADHTAFLEGAYAPFDQLEIEYAGVVDRADAHVSWGDTQAPQLDAEFATIQTLVTDAYASAGLSLTPSRRRKYDWAVTEVFAPRR